MHFLERLNLEPTNTVIDQYNRYYVLEKECVMGSARLAARHFTPVPQLTTATLADDHPTLPVPELRRVPAERRLKLSLTPAALSKTGYHESISLPDGLFSPA